MSRTNIRVPQSLRNFRKQLLVTFRNPLHWNPFPWAIGVYINLCTTSFNSFIAGIVSLALCIATTASAISMPLWLPMWWIYKQFRRIYYRWWNVRFCKKCGGIFKLYAEVIK